jgi:hypothetical protein
MPFSEAICLPLIYFRAWGSFAKTANIEVAAQRRYEQGALISRMAKNPILMTAFEMLGASREFGQQDKTFTGTLRSRKGRIQVLALPSILRTMTAMPSVRRYKS